MRIRTRGILAGFVLVGAVLLGTASAASAAEEEVFKNKEAEECAKLLIEENKTPKDCQEAPSPILPATN